MIRFHCARDRCYLPSLLHTLPIAQSSYAVRPWSNRERAPGSGPRSARCPPPLQAPNVQERVVTRPGGQVRPPRRAWARPWPQWPCVKAVARGRYARVFAAHDLAASVNARPLWPGLGRVSLPNTSRVSRPVFCMPHSRTIAAASGRPRSYMDTLAGWCGCHATG